MTEKPAEHVKPVTDPRALAARIRLQGLTGQSLRQVAWKPPAKEEPVSSKPMKWGWWERVRYWWITGKWL